MGQPPRRPCTVLLMWLPSITRQPPLYTMMAANVEYRQPPVGHKCYDLWDKYLTREFPDIT